MLIYASKMTSGQMNDWVEATLMSFVIDILFTSPLAVVVEMVTVGMLKFSARNHKDALATIRKEAADDTLKQWSALVAMGMQGPMDNFRNRSAARLLMLRARHDSEE